ncbi:hypothetical protein E4T44_12623 [Aureobasidium sp. EXF-8845]|nr:hypothetical protein E4T44_12623 [Aureobasidium sp. EXF-8845]KAI4834487.1 hypothetical protein E4T45_10036 [Aureobasidium sp. EXF-8846]
MYTLDTQGKRVYTLKKVTGAEVTKSAHPARFSPDDKYSRFFSLARQCKRRNQKGKEGPNNSKKMLQMMSLEILIWLDAEGTRHFEKEREGEGFVL